MTLNRKHCLLFLATFVILLIGITMASATTVPEVNNTQEIIDNKELSAPDNYDVDKMVQTSASKTSLDANVKNDKTSDNTNNTDTTKKETENTTNTTTTEKYDITSKNINLSKNIQTNVKSADVYNFSYLANLLSQGSLDNPVDLPANAIFRYDETTDSAYMNGITFTSSVRINGNSAVINGNNQARVFNIVGDENLKILVHIDNVNITNANSSRCSNTDGGAIHVNLTAPMLDENNNFQTLVNITHSTFDNCYSPSNGGAVYLASPTAINYIRFRNNTAENGGAIYVDTDGVRAYPNYNFDLINNTAVNRTTPDGGNGGGMYIKGKHLGIVNVTFTGNNASRNGGGVYWEGEDGGLEYTNFYNNTAGRSGGAIYWKGEQGLLSYSRLYNNTATGEVIDNIGGGDGGAIIWIGSNGEVNHSVFINNYAKYRGGAMFMEPPFMGNTLNLEAVCDNITVKNSYFESNEAGLNGGAIEWFEGATNGTVLNSSFVNNVANRSGGSIYWCGSNGTVRDSNFANNIAKGISMEDRQLDVHEETLTPYGGNGGAIIWVGADALLYNNTFSNNKANMSGGAVWLRKSSNITIGLSRFIHNVANESGGAIIFYVGATDGHVIDCLFKDNFAGIDGGAVVWEGEEGEINNSNFINNTAKRSGGSVYWLGSNGTINSTNFINNTALGEVYDILGGGDGGAVIWLGSNGDIDNSTFTNNKAKYLGGAIFLQPPFTIENGQINTDVVCENISVMNSRFITNHAGTDGGAVGWFKGASFGSVLNSTFINNTANRSAGAIYWSGSNGTVNDSYFDNNEARGINSDDRGSIISGSATTKGGTGGAVLWIGSDALLYNNTFNNNHAHVYGGAVFIRDNNNVTIRLSKFNNNGANVSGGALNFYNGSTHANIYDSQFNNNYANRSGGAVYWFGTDGGIQNSSFINNTARGTTTHADETMYWVELTTYDKGNQTGDGGAVIWLGSIGNIQNSTFENNTANRSGGSVYWMGNNGTVNSTKFISNNAVGEITDTNGGGDGGAIVWQGSNGNVTDSTFTNNTAKYRGGAAFLKSYEGTCENITIEKSVFTYNEAGTNGGAVDFFKGATYGQIINSTFQHNLANRSAGAVYWYGQYGSIYNSIFEYNEAKGLNITDNRHLTDDPNDDSKEFAGSGGAIVWIGSDAIVYNTTFDNNYAHLYGGAIFLRDNNNVTIRLSKFNDNGANRSGGALNFHNGATMGHIYDSEFNDNYANRSGGAVFWSGTRGGIHNTSFINNTARGTSTYNDGNLSGDGGAILWLGSIGNVQNSTFENNSANLRGGAIFLSRADRDMFRNSVFINNTAGNHELSDGGAIMVDDGATNTDIINCTFTENKVPGKNITQPSGAVYYYGDGGAVSFGAGCTNGTVQDSTFTSNFANANGGAVRWDGDNGKVINSKFYNNTALYAGGALRLSGNDLLVNNSLFEGHKDPAGDYMWGSAIYIRGDRVDIENSNFTNNTDCHAGGAIYVNGNYGTLTNNNFNKNNATVGGAVYIDGNYTELYNSLFNNSVSLENGSALYIQGHYATVSYSEFCNNNVTGNGTIFVEGNITTLSHNNITNNHASDNGGAIYVKGPLTTITRSKIENNNATKGGSIFVDGESTLISSSDISNSKATSDGGAIYIKGENTLITKTNVTDSTGTLGGAIYVAGNDTMISFSNVSHNKATSNGGGIFIEGHRAIITGSDIASNNATHGGSIYVHGDKTTISDSNIMDSKSTTEGGGIYIEGSNTTLSDSNVINNNGSTGGAIYVKGHYTKITGSSVSYNHASNEAGAVIIVGDNTNITDSEFNHNNATKNAGAMEILGTNTSVTYCNLTSNIAKEGGALYINGTNSTIMYSNFDLNSAYTNGGTIHLQGGKSGIILQTCNFTNSKTINDGSTGGSIYWTDGSGNNAMVLDCTFINSHTVRHGGAITFHQINDGTIDKCTFINCTSGKDGGDGGAIYVGHETGTSKNCTLTNSRFINCSAIGAHNSNGGSVTWLASNSTMANNTFINSFAHNSGGSILLDGGSSNIILYNNTFTNSSSAGVHDQRGGGAVFVRARSANITFVDCTFEESTSNGSGGAVSTFDNTNKDHSYINCTFVNNTVLGDKNGGALYYHNGVNVTNTTFEDNLANQGGALFLNAGESNITNTNLTGNNATKGSAIYVNGGKLNLKDIVLLDNQAHARDWNYENNNNGNVYVVDSEGNVQISGYFRGWDNYLNAIYADGKTLTFSNVEYYGLDGIKRNTDDPGDIGSTPKWREIGQTVIVEAYGNDQTMIYTETTTTDDDGKYSFNINHQDIPGFSAFRVYHPEDTYYTYLAYAIAGNLAKISVTVPDITYSSTTSDRVSIKVNVTDDVSHQPLSGNVTVYLNTTLEGFKEDGYNWTLELDSNGEATFDAYPLNGYLNASTYEVTAVYKGNAQSSYLPINSTTTFNVYKATTSLGVDYENYYTYNLTTNITVTVNETGADIIPAVIGEGIYSGKVTVNVLSEEYYKGRPVVNDTYILDLVNTNTNVTDYLRILNSGNYYITANFTGTNNYLSTSTQAVLRVEKAPSVVNVATEDISTRGTEHIYVHVEPEISTGNITIQVIGDKGYDETFTNVPLNASSIANLNITGLEVGTYYVIARYPGDINHYPNQNISFFHVINPDFPKDIQVSNMTYGENRTMYIIVPNDYTGDVQIFINTTDITGECDFDKDNGLITFNTGNLVNIASDGKLVVGSYNVSVQYTPSAHDQYVSSNMYKLFYVFKAQPNVTVGTANITYGFNETIKVNLTSYNASGKVNITVYNETGSIVYTNYSVTLANNSTVDSAVECVLNYTTAIPGNYIVKVEYCNDTNYNDTIVYGQFQVVRPVITIAADRPDIFVEEFVTLFGTVSDGYGVLLTDGTVNITVYDSNNNLYKNNTVELQSSTYNWNSPYFDNGTYTANATYLRDGIVLATSNQVEFAVNKIHTITNVTVLNSTVYNVTIKVVVTENETATQTATGMQSAKNAIIRNGTIRVWINSTTEYMDYDFTPDNETLILVLNRNPVNIDTTLELPFKVEYLENWKYLNSTGINSTNGKTITSIAATPIASNVTIVTDDNVYVGNTVTINGRVYRDDGIEVITGQVEITVDGNTLPIEKLSANGYTTTYTTDRTGEIPVTVHYLGNKTSDGSKYVILDSTNRTSFTVKKIPTITNVTIADNTIGNVTLHVNVTDARDINQLVREGNITVTDTEGNVLANEVKVEYKNGENYVTVKLDVGTAQTIYVKVHFSETDTYLSSDAKNSEGGEYFRIDITKIPTVTNIVEALNNSIGNVTLKINVTNATGTLVTGNGLVRVLNSTNAIVLGEGKIDGGYVNITLKGVNTPGSIDVNVTYMGDDIYLPSNAHGNNSADPTDPTYNITTITVVTDPRITISVNNTNPFINETFTINGTVYGTDGKPVNGGFVNITIDGISLDNLVPVNTDGTYSYDSYSHPEAEVITVNSKYEDNGKVLATSQDVEVTVRKLPSITSVEIINGTLGNVTIRVNVTNTTDRINTIKSGNITVTNIDGTLLANEVKINPDTGITDIKLNNITRAGDITVNVRFNGNNYFLSSSAEDGSTTDSDYIKFTVDKIPTITNVEVLNNTLGNVTLGINVTNTTTSHDLVTKGIVTVYNASNMSQVFGTRVLDGGRANITLNVINEAGIVEVYVLYSENDIYLNSTGSNNTERQPGEPTDTTIINVITEPSITIMVNNTSPVINETFIINGTVYGADGKPVNGGFVNITIDGVSLDNLVPVSAIGEYSVIYRHPEAEVITVNSKYVDNGKVLATSQDVDVTVGKLPSITGVEILDTTLGNVTIRVNVTNTTDLVNTIKSGNITVTNIDGKLLAYEVEIDSTTGITDIKLNNITHAGDITVNVRFNGNDYFLSSSADDGSTTDPDYIKFTVDKIPTITNIVDVLNNSVGNVTLRINVTNSTGTLVTGNGLVRVLNSTDGVVLGEGKVNGGYADIRLNGVYSPGSIDVNVTYMGDDIYLPSNAHGNNSDDPTSPDYNVTTITVIAGPYITIEVNNTSPVINETFIINGTVYGADGKPVSGGFVNVTIDGVSLDDLVPVSAIGEYSVIYRHPEAETITINSKYVVNGEVLATSQDVEVTVGKLPTITSVEILDTTLGNVTIRVNVTNTTDLVNTIKSGNITVTNIDGKLLAYEVEIDPTTGITDIKLNNITHAGDITVNVRFNGNDYFLSSSADDGSTTDPDYIKFTVDKIPTITNIVDVLNNSVGNVTLKINVTNTTGTLVTGNGLVRVLNSTNGAILGQGSLENGYVNIRLNGVYSPGSIDVNVTYMGDDIYLPSNAHGNNSDDPTSPLYNVTTITVIAGPYITIEVNNTSPVINETFTINGTVYGADGKPVNSGYVNITIDGKSLDDLIPVGQDGTYSYDSYSHPEAETITINSKYVVNGEVLATSQDVEVTVGKLPSITCVEILDTTFGNVTIRVNVTNTTDLVNTIKSGNITVTNIDGTLLAYEVEIDSTTGITDIRLNNITHAGDIVVNVRFNGNDYFLSSSAEDGSTSDPDYIKFTVDKIPTITNVEVLNNTLGNVILGINVTNTTISHDLVTKGVVTVYNASNMSQVLGRKVLDGGRTNITLSGIDEAGIVEVYVVYSENDIYLNSTGSNNTERQPGERTDTTIINVVTEPSISIMVNNTNPVINETFIINGTVYGADGKPVSGGFVNITIDDVSLDDLVPVGADGVYSVIYRHPEAEVITVNSKYVDNGKVLATSEDVDVTVGKLPSITGVEILDTTLGNVTIRVNVTNTTDLVNTIKSGNITVTNIDGTLLAYEVEIDPTTGITDIKLNNITRAGDIYVKVSFNGNDYFLSSSADDGSTSEEGVIKFTVDKIPTITNIVDVLNNSVGNVTLRINVTNSTGTLVTGNGLVRVINSTNGAVLGEGSLENGYVDIILDGVYSPGSIDVNITYMGDDIYLPSNAHGNNSDDPTSPDYNVTTITVISGPYITIEVNNTSPVINETFTINGTVYGADGKPVNGGYVNITIDGVSLDNLVTVKTDGTYSYDSYSHPEAETITINSKYVVNGEVLATSQDVEVTVGKLPSITGVEILDTTLGNVTIRVNVTNTTDLVNTIKSGNITVTNIDGTLLAYEVEIDSTTGITDIKLNNITHAGDITVNVRFNGNDYFLSSSADDGSTSDPDYIKFTVDKIPTITNIVDVLNNSVGNVTLRINVTNSTGTLVSGNGLVRVINSTNGAVLGEGSLENGYVDIILDGVYSPGSIDVNVTYMGDDIYLPSNAHGNNSDDPTSPDYNVTTITVISGPYITIEVNNTSPVINETFTINGTVYGADGKPVNKGYVNITIDGVSLDNLVPVKTDGTYSYDSYSHPEAETITINSKYVVNGEVLATSQDVEVTVGKLPTTTSVEIINSTLGNVTIRVNVTNTTDLVNTIKSGNITVTNIDGTLLAYEVEIDSTTGITDIKLNNITHAGDIVINVRFNGNDYFLSSSAEDGSTSDPDYIKFTVDKIPTITNVEVLNNTLGNVILGINVTNTTTSHDLVTKGVVTVYNASNMSQVLGRKVLDGGRANITLSGVNDAGIVEVYVVYSENDIYLNSTGSNNTERQPGERTDTTIINVVTEPSITIMVNNTNPVINETFIINGTVYGADGKPVNGGFVNITFDGVSLDSLVPVGADGEYSVIYRHPEAEVITVNSKYVDNGKVLATSQDVDVTVGKLPSITSVDIINNTLGNVTIRVNVSNTTDLVNTIKSGNITVTNIDGTLLAYEVEIDSTTGITDIKLNNITHAGDITVNIRFNGNDYFLSSSADDGSTSDHDYIKFTVDKIPTITNIVDVLNNSVGNVTLRINVTNSTGTLVTGNGLVRVLNSTNGALLGEGNLENGYVNIRLNGVYLPGSIDVNITYMGDDIYLPSNAHGNNSDDPTSPLYNVTTITVISGPYITIEVNNTSPVINETFTINGTVYGADGKPVNGGFVNITIDGVSLDTLVPVSAIGEYSVIYRHPEAETITINSKYVDNGEVLATSQDVEVTVGKLPTITSVEIINSTFGNVTIRVNVTNTTDLVNTIKSGNISVRNVNGTLLAHEIIINPTTGITDIRLNNITQAGDIYVMVTYNGNDYFLPSAADDDSTSTEGIIKISVEKYPTITNVEILNSTVGNVRLAINVTNTTGNLVTTGEVIIRNTTGEIIAGGPLTNGKTELVIPTDSTGRLEVIVTYNENEIYYSSYAKNNTEGTPDNIIVINVIDKDKITVNATPDNVTIGEKVNVTGKLTNATGDAVRDTNITIVIDDDVYTVLTDVNGTYTLENVTNTAGLNNVTVYVTGDRSINATTTFTVNKIPTNTVVEIVNSTVGNVTIDVSVTDKDARAVTNGTLIISVAGKTTTVPVDGTTTRVKLDIDVADNVPVKVEYRENDIYLNSTGIDKDTIPSGGKPEEGQTLTNITTDKQIAEITVTTTPDNTTVGSTVTITGNLTVEGKAIPDAYVEVTIDGITTIVKTDSDGSYKVTNVTDHNGTVQVNVYYAGNTTVSNATANTGYLVNKIPTVTLVEVTNSTVDNVSIDVIVKDDKNNTVTSGELIISTPSGKKIVNVTGEITHVKLDINSTGTVPVTVEYAENRVYLNSTGLNKTSYDLDPENADTFNNITVNKLNTTITANATSPVKAGNSTIINGRLVDEYARPISGATVVVKVNDTIIGTVTTDENGLYTLTFNDTIVGTHNVSCTYSGNDTYIGSKATTNFTVEKIRTSITLDEIEDVPVGNNITITGKLVDEFNNPIANATVTITVDNDTQTVRTNPDGTYNTTYPANTVGNKTVKVEYPGDDKYIGADTEDTFNVEKIHANNNITVPVNATVDTPVNITGVITDDDGNPIPNLPVNVTVNNVTYTTTTDENGTYTVPVNNTVSGTNNVTVTAGNDTVIVDPVKDTFDVRKLNTTITLNPTDDVTVGENATITGNLKDENGKTLTNKTVIVKVDGNEYTTTTDNEGNFKVEVPTDKLGPKIITAEFTGDDKYNGDYDTGLFNVNKIHANNNVTLPENPEIDTPVNITGVITDDDGNPIPNLPVNVTVNNVTYTTITDENGTYSVPVNNTVPGVNNVTVTAGNETVEVDPVNDMFTVGKLNTTITINPIDNVKVGENATINGNLVDETGKPVPNATITVTVDDIPYTTTTDNEGNYNISVPTTSVGPKVVTAEFEGNDKYNGDYDMGLLIVDKIHANNNVSVPVNPKIDTPVNITGVITDDDGNPIPNLPVNVTVNNVTYTTTTDENGTYTVPVNNTVPGVNNVTVTAGNETVEVDPVSDTFTVGKINTTVTIDPTSDVTVDTPVTITGKLLDEDGNPISNADITVTLDGIPQNVTTDSEGNYKATFPTNTTGTKPVTVEYQGNETYNGATTTGTVNVVKNNGTILLDLPTDAKAGQPANITGQVIDKDGKPVPYTPLNVTVNGKMYPTITDENGNYHVEVDNVVEGENNVTVTGINDKIDLEQADGTFNATKPTATLTVDQVSDAKVGDNVTITGKLVDEQQNPIPNAVITIKVDNETYTVITDKDGNYELTTDKIVTGLNNVTVTHESDIYTTNTANTTFNVTKHESIVTVDSIVGIVGEDITLTAHVTDENGNNITGGNLVFKLNGRTLREDGRFDTDDAAPMKFHVENGLVTYTMKADLYLRSGKNITASYSGTTKYEEAKGNVATASIKKRTAQVTVTVTPSTAKQDTDIVFTATLTDVTPNATNSTCLTTNATVIFKVNNVTLKDESGQVLYIPATHSVVNYAYHVPRGMAAVYSGNGSVRDYLVEAVYANDMFYPDIRNTTVFNVERSIVNINFIQTTVHNNELSIKATFTDYEGYNLVGTNKICVKVNGKTYQENGETKYFYIQNGNVDLSGLKLEDGTTVKEVMLVTGDREAYLSARQTTTDITTG